MNVSSIQRYQIQQYNLEQRNLQEKREEDYRKLVERKNFEQIVAERVARNLRLDLDKGKNIDLEC
jgi:hypothetical protein